MKLEKFYIILTISLLLLFILSDLISNYNDLNEINNSNSKQLNLDSSNEIYDHVFKLNLTIESKNKLKIIYKKLYYDIKNFLCPPTSIYIHEPIARFFLNNFLINKQSTISSDNKQQDEQNWLSYQTKANIVTIICILTSLPIIWLLVVDDQNGNYRKFACFLLQLRNILDCMDGNLSRMDKHKKENNGFDYGRFFDSIGSSLPALFFLIGSYIFILKQFDVFSLNESKLKDYNCFYYYLHLIVRWLKSKISSSYLPVYNSSNDDLNLSKSEQTRNIYFYIALFTVYMIAVGSYWNKVFDYYVLYYCNYNELVMVSRLLFLLNKP